jgi:hypothetical protein
MPITGEGRFTHARFMSSNKNWIKAIWMTGDGKYEEIIIETNLENPDYKMLLEQFTTDEISTMTDQFAKEESANFTALVKEIATDYGLVYDPNAEEGKDRLSIDHIFEPPEGDDGTDLLFNIKLKIFELDAVTESDNDDLKKQLREADTPLKAFYIAGQFLYAE